MSCISLAFALTLILSGCVGRGDNLTPSDRPDAAGAVDGAQAPDAAPTDAPMADAGDPLNPMTLAETGLYADFDLMTISDDVTEYEPQFELWSDGALKRRWVQLPAGVPIDSSTMSFWVYPEGTKIWKEFRRGGLLVETRLYWKQGPTKQDWKPFTFAWNAEQNEAVSVRGGVSDALGTGHEVPNIFDCGLCHSPQPDVLLGYSAIQLDGTIGGHNLSDLVAAGSLTDNPVTVGPTFFPLPGAAADQAALGYLHGNCGGCHSTGSSVLDIVPMLLRLEPERMATVEATDSYTTAVGVVPTLSVPGATSIVEPGDPSASALRIRMNSTANIRMPPVSSSVVDSGALAAVDAWINVVSAP